MDDRIVEELVIVTVELVDDVDDDGFVVVDPDETALPMPPDPTLFPVDADPLMGHNPDPFCPWAVPLVPDPGPWARVISVGMWVQLADWELLNKTWIL